MRIGILTFHGVDNYGALLQAYALKRSLEAPGREVFFVDYRPASVEKPFRWNWKRGGLLGNNIVNCALGPRFERFRKQYLPRSKRCYATADALASNPPEMDIAVFGSDQIWNPGMFGGFFDPAFFGSWTSDGMRRVAYAASFGGGGNVDETHRAELNRLLGRFDAVSVRESAGADLVEAVSKQRPAVTLDPTLLLDDYEELLEPVPGIEGPFLFMFAMQYSPDLKAAAKSLSETLGLPVVMALSSTTGLKLFDRVGRAIYASPGQWLWLIKNAQIVLTNSFHGTVFSMIFCRPFAVVPLVGKMASRNERMVNLLELAGIKGRLLNPSCMPEFQSIAEAPIDWHKFSLALSSRREESLRFLNTAIGMEPAAPVASY